MISLFMVCKITNNLVQSLNKTLRKNIQHSTYIKKKFLIYQIKIYKPSTLKIYQNIEIWYIHLVVGNTSCGKLSGSKQ